MKVLYFHTGHGVGGFGIVVEKRSRLQELIARVCEVDAKHSHVRNFGESLSYLVDRSPTKRLTTTGKEMCRDSDPKWASHRLECGFGAMNSVWRQSLPKLCRWRCSCDIVRKHDLSRHLRSSHRSIRMVFSTNHLLRYVDRLGTQPLRHCGPGVARTFSSTQ